MKKKIIITVSVILSVFIIGSVAATLFFNNFSISVSTGSALLSENGTLFLVKRNSPVRLSFDSEKKYADIVRKQVGLSQTSWAKCSEQNKDVSEEQLKKMKCNRE